MASYTRQDHMLTAGQERELANSFRTAVEDSELSLDVKGPEGRQARASERAEKCCGTVCTQGGGKEH